MENASLIAHDFAPLTTDDWKKRFCPAFKHYVGTYGRNGESLTLKDIAARLGRTVRTVESWRDGENLPGFADLMNLIGLLPNGFANQLLAAHGIGGLRDLSASDIGVHHIAECTANFSMNFICWMDDQRVDHVEQQQAIALARGLRDHCDRFLASVDANPAAVLQVIAGQGRDAVRGVQ